MDRERDLLGPAEMTYDAAGLIPAVIQDQSTGEVLMVAYMNAESLARTLETGRTWFWSRSRRQFWMKGETSGHVQDVHEVRYDCDADCLLVTVTQRGAGACHTGERSCFYRRLYPGPGPTAEADSGARDAGARDATDAAGAAPSIGAVLTALFAVLEERRREMPEGSYTAELLGGPLDSLLKKVAEESGEVIMAAKDGDEAHLRYEVGDLLYHLLVVMVRQGISLDDLAAELDSRRTG